MKSSNKIILTSILILLRILNAYCSSCVEQIDEQGRFLTISKDTSCTIESSIQEEYEKIFIGGKLVIQTTNQDVHIKYKFIEFGEQGELKILQKNSSYSIIIEQKSQNCIHQHLQLGSLKIEGQILEDFYLKENLYSNRSSINLFSNPQNFGFSVGEIVSLIDFKQKDNYLQEFEIYSLEGNLISLSNLIKNDITINSYNLFPQPILLHTISLKKATVLIKNACISCKVEKIQGAQFENPQYLNLINGEISHSIFYNDQGYKKFPENLQVILLSSKVVQNSFFNLNVLILNNTDVNEFNNNVLVGVGYSSFNIGPPLVNITAVDSNLNFDQHCLSSAFKMIGSKLKNSQIEIKSINSYMDVCFLSSVMVESKVFVKDKIQNMTFSQSVSTNTQFYFEEIQRVIRVAESYIYLGGLGKNWIKMSKYESFGDLNILIQNSTFKGGIGKLVYETEHIKVIGDTINNNDRDIGKNHRCTIVRMINTTIIFEKKYIYSFQKLFNADHLIMTVTDEESKQYILTELETYNSAYPYSLPREEDLDPLNNRYFVEYRPSFYSINNPVLIKLEEDQTLEEYFILLMQNGDIIEQARNSRLFIQIMRHQIHYILFQNKMRQFLDPSSFTLILGACSNDWPLTNEDSYTFKVPFSQRAIQSVAVNIESMQGEPFSLDKEKSEKTISIPERFAFKLNFTQNEFVFTWKGCFAEAQIHFQFLYCELGLFNNREGDCEECVNRQKVGMACRESCNEGYYLIRDKCKKCSFGCKKCENRSQCLECFSEFFNDSGECRDMCSSEQFFFNNKCTNCYLYCEICQQNRSEQSGISITHYTAICEQCRRASDCPTVNQSQCHQSCSQCLSKSYLECTSCSSNYQNDYGICIHNPNVNA